MNINIKTTGITLSANIGDYVTKRLEKIDKMLAGDPSVKCDVELGKTTDHHQKGEIFRAEIHITGGNLNAYASSEKNELFAAIDEVRDDIFREISSDKSRRTSLVRRGGIRVKNLMKGLWPGNWRSNANE